MTRTHGYAPRGERWVEAVPHGHWHTTTFVGRAHEVAHIHHLLVEDANCRLLTLVGPSGIGKTRLALEVVQRILTEATDNPARPFVDGIIFVPLTPVSEPSGMVAAIAAAAGLHLGGGLSSQQQLFNYLHDKDTLIVLDHIEHLLAGASQHYQTLAGGRGFFRIPAATFGAVLAGAGK